jgi:competence protein ComEA
VRKAVHTTKTELFLLALTGIFLLFLLLVHFLGPARQRDTFTVTPERAMPAVAEEDWQVNINTATEEELQRLEGIGPVLAERIVAYREAHGPFTSAEDLLAVEGIGESTLEGVRDIITTEGEP